MDYYTLANLLDIYHGHLYLWLNKVSGCLFGVCVSVNKNAILNNGQRSDKRREQIQNCGPPGGTEYTENAFGHGGKDDFNKTDGD